MRRSAGRTRVVVVGGGIAGVFAAYFLARMGAEVILVERETVGSQASGSNPGGLNPLYGPGIPGPLQSFALEAFRLHLEGWEEFRESGIDFDGRIKTRLNLAFDPDDLRLLQHLKDSYDAAPGFSAHWVSPTEVISIEPRVDRDIARGLLVEGDAKVEPGPYTRAIARAAEVRGATLVTADARGLERDGQRVRGVKTDEGTIDCDAAIIATGAWCAEPAKWLGCALPVDPIKGEMVLVAVDGGAVRMDFAWRDAAIYQTRGAHLWLAGSEERAGFNRNITQATRASILARAARMMPVLARSQVIMQTAGLRPVTPDGMPAIGIPPGWDNLCVALGGGRKGMLLGAGMGRAAADLLLTGATNLSIGPCSAGRFAYPARDQTLQTQHRGS